jgi:hypothetical protein
MVEIQARTRTKEDKNSGSSSDLMTQNLADILEE